MDQRRISHLGLRILCFLIGAIPGATWMLLAVLGSTLSVAVLIREIASLRYEVFEVAELAFYFAWCLCGIFGYLSGLVVIFVYPFLGPKAKTFFSWGIWLGFMAVLPLVSISFWGNGQFYVYELGPSIASILLLRILRDA